MNAHIFIDAENVKPDFCFMAVEKYRREYNINRVDIIGKEDTISQKYKTAGEPYRVQNCYFGKNSADTWLCVEISKAVFEESEVETIIIVSSDRDFLPAIKLAVEKNKSVIMISNGFGHKNLRKLLRELKINLDNVQLVDYRDGLIVPEEVRKKKKKSLSALMRDATPAFSDERSQKLQKIYSRLSYINEKFFRKREENIKFIFVKRGEILSEVPFIDGMNLITFINVMRNLDVISKKDDVPKIIEDSFLKLENKKVYLLNEDDLTETGSEFDGLSFEVLQYFLDSDSEVRIISLKHDENFFEVPFIDGIAEEIFLQILQDKEIATAETFDSIIEENFLKVEDGKIYFLTEEELFFAESSQKTQTIFVSYGGEFIEVPFENGMATGKFMQTLRDYGITGNDKFILQVLRDSLLKISGGKVYLVLDEETQDDFEVDFENLSSESLKFLSANNDNIQFVRIFHKGVSVDVPFVNGMNFVIFAQIIEELKISTKGSSRGIISDNGFKIIHGMVYL